MEISASSGSLLSPLYDLLLLICLPNPLHSLGCFLTPDFCFQSCLIPFLNASRLLLKISHFILFIAVLCHCCSFLEHKLCKCRNRSLTLEFQHPLQYLLHKKLKKYLANEWPYVYIHTFMYSLKNR